MHSVGWKAGSEMARIIKEITPTVAAMEAAGAEMTRENFLYWAFAGNPPDGELDAEIEAELPIQFRREALDDPEGGLQ